MKARRYVDRRGWEHYVCYKYGDYFIDAESRGDFRTGYMGYPTAAAAQTVLNRRAERFKWPEATDL